LEVKDLPTEEMILNMGPQHPSTHGVLRLRLHTDGEIVSNVEPIIGYLHRTFEKHAENLTYPQVIPFVDRCDYLAAINSEHVYAMTIEKLLGIEVPEYVEYLRVIFAELQRIASHLVFFGTFGLDAGAFTPFLYAFREREKILDLFEMTCGARLLYNYIWIGGLSHDIPDGFVEKAYDFLEEFAFKKNGRTRLREYYELLTANKIFIERTADVGLVKPDIAIAYGITGPNLRASGVNWDLRKKEPYSVYDRFEWQIAVGNGAMGAVGDTWDRYWVRMKEMEESAKIIKQALDALPSVEKVDVRTAVPRRVKPPVGEIYFRGENPRGELGFHIISDGSPKPYRLKMRSPAFCNLSSLNQIAKGWMIGDLVLILGSLDIVLGEIDR
jgi:NADH-quinone oxidoreductase subunit D